MNNDLSRRTRMHHFASAMLPRTAATVSSFAEARLSAVGAERLSFPPTRAARASRSRGVFFEDADPLAHADRPRWIDALGGLVAVVITALALAVCVNKTSAVPSAGFGANPGPGIVAAASVAPLFVEPTQSR
jgi:hypothetical protein